MSIGNPTGAVRAIIPVAVVAVLSLLVSESVVNGQEGSGFLRQKSSNKNIDTSRDTVNHNEKGTKTVQDELLRLLDNADTDRFPSFVLLELEYEGGQSGVCGGTLVHEDVVLSSARCGQGLLSGTAHIGATLSSEAALENVFQSNLAAWVVHPKFNSDTFANDAMLIRLNSKAPSSVPVVEYNRNAMFPLPGQAVTVLGFGQLDSSSLQNPTQVLQRADMQVIDVDTCNVGDGGAVMDSLMICAGMSEVGGVVRDCESDCNTGEKRNHRLDQNNRWNASMNDRMHVHMCVCLDVCVYEESYLTPNLRCHFVFHTSHAHSHYRCRVIHNSGCLFRSWRRTAHRVGNRYGIRSPRRNCVVRTRLYGLTSPCCVHTCQCSL